VTTNGRSNTATIFDINTLAPVTELATGKNPDALIYDSYMDKVFVFNHSGASATVIDLAGKVTGTVELGGEGVEAGVSDGKGIVFVNLEDTHEIVSIDAKTLAVKGRWDISPGEEPTGLAIDTKNNRLFTVCHNELMLAIDASSGKIVAQVPIGKRVDGVVFDPATNLIFSSNGEGSITIIKEVSANEYKVIDTIQSAPGARTIALDLVTHHIFVSTAQFGETPAATAENPNPRPGIVPGTFMVMEFGNN
jgi:DNA-binding beta-propeller fold protein YncE